jgi:hypothetical protein
MRRIDLLTLPHLDGSNPENVPGPFVEEFNDLLIDGVNGLPVLWKRHGLPEKTTDQPRVKSGMLFRILSHSPLTHRRVTIPTR